ncbi:hypothetical protein N7517_010311 [Penicillium concentricum]|uniref:Uncharacterized protein n=1 Tax=Penicillium concentricum TaxID=293559 RepID=A0A9W9R8P5_9EURO|nr:uncharacterized protein N7517_010311 [Penicillium concentricum]KAJ5355702.1 hypothetical protein N7517_010311 [Penicillium concentricum]
MNPAAQYIITHSSWRSHYDVSTKDKTHLYRVVSSSFTPGKPDLTFHRSADSSGPIAGVCKFRHFSSDCEIGLGDPERPNKMDWQYLHKEGFMKRTHWFCMELEDGTKQTFTWKRTHSLGTGSENYKLVEGARQTVVAVFSSGGTFSKTTGYLDIYLHLGPQFYLMALISRLGIVEMDSRQRSTGAGGAAGGGAC